MQRSTGLVGLGGERSANALASGPSSGSVRCSAARAFGAACSRATASAIQWTLSWLGAAAQSSRAP